MEIRPETLATWRGTLFATDPFYGNAPPALSDRRRVTPTMRRRPERRLPCTNRPFDEADASGD
jgi:hypothetical protein